MRALSRLRAGRRAILLAAVACVAGAVSAAPAAATARRGLHHLTLIRRDAVGAAVGDGRQWLAWGSAPGLFTTKWVQLNRPDRLSAPGCTPPDDLAFGRLLTTCQPTDGGRYAPRVIDLRSGKVIGPEPDIDPADGFGQLGRFWLIGSHESYDPHIDSTTAYLNFRDGHASYADGARDIDTIGLDRLPAEANCDRPHGPNPRNQLRYGPRPNSPLRLISCRTGRGPIVSRCPRGCQALGPGLDPDVAVWLEGRRTLRAVRADDHGRYAWRLPHDVAPDSPSARLAQAHGHILISFPTSHPDATVTWAIYATRVPPHPAQGLRQGSSLTVLSA